ncbi:hypothetical protein [Synechococcus sp. BL107]|uniref:hypothetical protein n=1 Tax=Synechococcus sp. BL107 TaxID=313625 RepID=UPI0012EA7030|nr:hypothetical protein [Synechococcus sp. BL107]
MRPIVSIQGATTTAMRPNALAWFNAAQDDAQSPPWQPRSQPGQSAERWSWGARVVRVMSGWHRCIVPTTGRFNGPTRLRLLEWLKAAQCEGCGGETRSFLLFE